MKTKTLICMICGLFILMTSCTSDDDNQASNYPKLFLFDSYQMGAYAEYLIGDNETYTEINPTTREDTLVVNTLQWLSELPNIFQEFELLDETMIRLKMGLDSQVLDTTLAYQTDEPFLEFGWFLNEVGDKFLEYNSSDEEMYVRNRADISLPGPNADNPDAFYYDYISIDKAEFETLDEYLNYLLGEYDYAVGDTVIVYEPQRLYK